MLNGVVPEDTIALCGYGIDVHSAEKGGQNYLHYLEPGQYYGIGYGALVPASEVENILTAGKSVSCESGAEAAIMATALSMATGEAAGTARTLSPEAEIVLYSRERVRPYRRPALSRMASEEVSEVQFYIKPQAFYDENRIRLELGRTLTAFDPDVRQLKFDTGETESYDKLLLATGATNADVTLKGGTIFRNCFIDPYQGKMAALFAKDKGFTKAAVIYAKDDDYSNGLKDAFIENCEANGIEVAYTGECMTTDTDYSSQAAQAVASGAELLYYPCFLDTVPLLVGAARNAGFTGAIMGGDGWDGSDTTGLAAQFEDCYFTNHYSSEDTAPAVQNFVQKYTEKYGTESLNACAALYYDAMYMLVQAAENAGGTDTASLVKGMTGMSFTGVGGDITLDENGDAIKSIAVNTYVDGAVKWTETLGSDGKVVSKAE